MLGFLTHCGTISLLALAASQLYSDHLLGASRETQASETSTTAAKSPINDSFIVSKLVHKQALFWEKIFSVFPSSTLVIHDSEDLDIIVQVIDDQTLVEYEPGNLSPQELREQRDKAANGVVKDLNLAIKKAGRLYPHFAPSSPAEAKIETLYLKDPVRRSRLLTGEVKIRSQSGLADRFAAAAKIAQIFLPQMEGIFASHGLPPSLTRMAFVESMFNIGARSKVGASGLWQFMPQTARLFMYVNDLIDERNSPIKATRAAAQLLLKNYQELNSWPHAITAYNHGVYGMQRAITSLNSHDFDLVIARYKSPSFGFASRNFYSEFIAARRVYYKNHSKPSRKSVEQKNLSSVVINQPISLNQISSLTGIQISDLARYNPCLLPGTLDKNATNPLPRFYEVFVPTDKIHKLRQHSNGKEENTNAF